MKDFDFEPEFTLEELREVIKAFTNVSKGEYIYADDLFINDFCNSDRFIPLKKLESMFEYLYHYSNTEQKEGNYAARKGYSITCTRMIKNILNEENKKFKPSLNRYLKNKHTSRLIENLNK